MSEAAEQRLREDTSNLISQFFMGVPPALERHREFLPPPKRSSFSDDHKYSEESINCINRIWSAIETYRDELTEQTVLDILVYLKRYRVHSKSCDPLKFAYFFGKALASKVGEQHDLDRKVVLTLTVWVLDILCSWHCEKTLPDDMRSKLDMSISQGKDEGDFGIYGIYFVFKVVSKIGVA